MSRKKKKKRERRSLFEGLREETKYGVFAVIFFVIAIFLFLSSLGKAGLVGDTLYNGLFTLLGVGYFLLPLVFIFVGISFFRSGHHNLVLPGVVAGLLFVLSGLGIVELFSGADSAGGGIIGSLVASPLVKLFDTLASFIILFAFLIISLLILFDTHPNLQIFSRIREKLAERRERKRELAELKALEAEAEEEYKEEYEDEGDEAEGEEEDGGEYEDEEEEEVEEDEEDEEPKKKSWRDKLSLGSSKKEGFAISAIGHHPYTPPSLSLLSHDKGKPGVGDVKANANIIKRTLQTFGINVEMDEISIGPSITRYSLKPAEGVKLSRIVGLQENLSLALAAHPIRIEAPIPGKSLVGIEIPNSTKTTVGLASLLSDPDFKDSPHPLYVPLGRGISGRAEFMNIAKAPHTLIAGATGSGKSVTAHTLITSLLYRNSPEHMRLILVDPKRVELTLYKDIPHLLTPVITDAKKAILALKWAAQEMDRRYDILEAESSRDILSYHKNVLGPAMKKLAAERAARGDEEEEDEEIVEAEIPETMPYIVIVIDELADIMQAYPRELESAIVRLAQMSRAVGIHLVLSTQRPSVNVVTGLIKANIPTRVALQVASQTDSRTIIDMGGAEKLLGAGDMLYMSGEMSKPVRLQSAFISEDEVKRVTKYLKDSFQDEYDGEIDFATTENGNTIFDSLQDAEDEDEDEDELYEDARLTVMKAGKASTSYLQRKLKVGYSRAARLMDMLEERGVIGEANGSKPREVLQKERTEEGEFPE